MPPAVLAWGAFGKVTLIAPRAASEVMMKSWTSGRDAIRYTPGTSPPHLCGRTGRVKMVPAPIRDRLSPTRKEKFWCKICLQPHVGQGGTPLVERWCWSLFSLLQMGASNSSLTPLNCILKNWDRFDPQGLKKTCLVFLCDITWPWVDGWRVS